VAAYGRTKDVRLQVGRLHPLVSSTFIVLPGLCSNQFVSTAVPL